MIRQPQEFIERAIHVAEGIWSTLDRIARALEGKSSSPVPEIRANQIAEGDVISFVGRTTYVDKVTQDDSGYFYAHGRDGFEVVLRPDTMVRYMGRSSELPNLHKNPHGRGHERGEPGR